MEAQGKKIANGLELRKSLRLANREAEEEKQLKKSRNKCSVTFNNFILTIKC